MPTRLCSTTCWGCDCRGCQDGAVDVLSSRILLRPTDLGRSRRFYRDVLGLAIHRSSALQLIPRWFSFSARDCWKCPGARPRIMTSMTGTGAAFCAWVRSMHAAHRLDFRRAGDPRLAPVPPGDRPPAERADGGAAARAEHPGPGRAGTDRGLC